MIRKQLQAAFLDYINNYLTIALFAEHNGLTEEMATKIIELGQQCHEAEVAEWKSREPQCNGIESDDDFRKRHAAWRNEK